MTATDPTRTVAEVVGETLGKHAGYGSERYEGGTHYVYVCDCGWEDDARFDTPQSGAHRDHQAQAVAAALRDAGWVK